MIDQFTQRNQLNPFDKQVIFLCYKYILHFSFLLNNVFVVANKPNTKRNKTTGCILYASNLPPLNSRVKDINLFSTLGLMASIKNIKHNIQCWFYETSIKI